MFGFSFAELLLVALVGLLVLGPKDLPKLMYGIGKLFRRISYIKYAFSHQFEDFMRAAEQQARKNGTEKLPTPKPDTQGEDDEDLGFDYARLPSEHEVTNKIEKP